jgi:hypothetical protein
VLDVRHLRSVDYKPREGMESAHLLPTRAQLFVRMSIETANVRADVGDAEKVEFHRFDHRRGQMFPTCAVVSEPMTSVPTAGYECRTKILATIHHPPIAAQKSPADRETIMPRLPGVAACIAATVARASLQP